MKELKYGTDSLNSKTVINPIDDTGTSTSNPYSSYKTQQLIDTLQSDLEEDRY